MSVVRSERLADQVHGILRNQILSRELLPGQRLSVPHLAHSLGASRSPVREAVQRLVVEGLADERPNHGAFVAAPNLDELVEMNQVRAPLEGLAAELMASRCNRTDLAELRSILNEHKAAFRRRDVPAVIRADLAFHQFVMEGSGNRELVRVLTSTHERVALAMAAGRPTTWPERAIEEHEAILDALVHGDPVTARAAGERHVLLFRERLLAKGAEDETEAMDGQQASWAAPPGPPAEREQADHRTEQQEATT